VSLSIPAVLASLSCYATPEQAALQSTNATLLISRLEIFGAFLETVFSSPDSIDQQLAIVSTLLAPNAILYLPITGTYGGNSSVSQGLQSLIEYAWIFNYYKNQQWTSVQTVGEIICVDPDLPNQLFLQITTVILFSPSLSNPYATGVPLTIALNYTILYNGPTAIISYIRLDIERQHAIETGEAHFSIFDVCRLINATCNGTNQVYNTIWDCVDFMSSLPPLQCQDALYMGDSFACRYLHHFLAVFRPDIHCIHTAPISPVCYTAQCNGLFFQNNQNQHQYNNHGHEGHSHGNEGHEGHSH